LRSPRHAKHIGFLNYSRRSLGIGAMAACAAMTGVMALPANAEVVQEEVKVSHLQHFIAPSIVTLPVTRDAFAITEYTVVQWPVPSGTTMASGYGYRSCAGCSAFHEGLDLNPGSGYPIQAIADGVVTQVGNPSGAFGVFAVVEHVIDGQTISSTYAHMQMGSLAVSVGDSVQRGQQVGSVGSTGQSTGAHLHFALDIGGDYIDPLPWLREHVNI
jgi:murein DD-endopeptidase MepM/ murein hydrolase activator NlpD